MITHERESLIVEYVNSYAICKKKKDVRNNVERKKV